MVKRLSILLVLAIMVASCILPSCTKDNFDMDRLGGEVKYDGSFAVPLVYSDVSFAQILGILDTTVALQENDEGYLSMFYHSYVESKKVQDLLNFGEVSYSKNISIGDFTSKGTRDMSLQYSTEENISFTLRNENTDNDEAEIDSLVLNSATLTYRLSSTFGLSSKFVVEFPSVRKNGVPFRDSITIGGSNQNEFRTVSLAGYTIDMTTTSRHFNEIPIKILVDLYYNGAPPTGGSFSVDVRFGDFNYKGMYGYFGYNELLIKSDTINITMFKQNPKYDWEHASFYFKKPRLTVTYWNSYGVPSEFFFTELDAYMQRNDVTWDMNSIIKPNFPLSEDNPFVMNHSLRPGFEAEGVVSVDSSNSYLDQIIPNRPTWFHFNAKAVTNYPGSAHTRNFIDENSRVRSKIEVEIPLYGHLYNFTYRDTADIDINSYVGNLPISRMAVNLNIKNNMPVAAKAQFYFVDENYNVLDSLIKTPDLMVLEAAEVDAYGNLMTSEPVNTPTRIEMTNSQISNLKNSRHLLIKITSNTAGDSQGGENVKLFRDYGFKLNIGLDVDLDVEGNVNSVETNKTVKNK